MADSRIAAKLALAAALAATTTVATMLVQIPIPPTRGYLNFGDIMVFTSALLFGRFVGGLGGGIGSATADIITGYAYFAPYTLVASNTIQVVSGAVVAIPLAKGLRNRIPRILV